jgi:transcriptional regulator with XRE-family HTH domain
MNNSAKERLGKKLAQIRRRKGMSTYDVAKKCGIAASNITTIEQGVHSTGIDRLEKIANVLGHEVDLVPIKKSSNGNDDGL